MNLTQSKLFSLKNREKMIEECKQAKIKLSNIHARKDIQENNQDDKNMKSKGK